MNEHNTDYGLFYLYTTYDTHTSMDFIMYFKSIN